MQHLRSKYGDFIHVISIDKTEISSIDFALCQEPTESLETFYNRQIVKPNLLVNGGFFNVSDGTTVLNFIDERQNINQIMEYRYGMAIVDNQLQYGHMDKIPNLRDFVSGYPTMIDNYVAPTITDALELNYNARRTALGYNDTKVFVICVDSPGVNFLRLQQIMIEFGIRYAINLDGGGSTRGLLNGQLFTETAWSRPIDNVFALYLKPLPPPPIYRVQVGAFIFKDGADSICATIKALPDKIVAGYAKAYVRYINGLYKVQVGAMGQKSGAEAIKADLASMGIAAFITTE